MKSKKGVKKAAKKVAVKEVKKILKKKVSKRTRSKGNVLHGRGGYFGDIGKRLGGHIGGVADEVVGIGKALTGSGAYSVKRNSLYESGGPPSIVNSKHTSIVRHREYICDVNGSTGFQILRYPINPGVSSTFPWLSGVAEGYEQYEITGMIFEFHSTSATAVGSTNTALGTVIMATEYNSNLPAFTNKLQMENHEYATTVCPDHSAIHPVECARGRTPLNELYVRSAFTPGIGSNPSSSSTPNNYNPLLYDLGQFYIATYGMQAASVIGELWVSYEIKFLKPALSNSTVSGTVAHWFYDSSLGSPPTSGAFFTNLRNKNNGATISGTTGTSMGDIAPGRYMMVVTFLQSSTASTVPALTVTNGNNVTMFATNASSGAPTTSYVGQPNGVATTQAVWAYGFELTGSSNNISLGACTVGTISSLDIYIMPYPNGFALSESRKAVDWDPIAVLSRRLMELEQRLPTFHEEDDEEEKYCDSVSSTPIQVLKTDEPELTRSQANLATMLLDRLSVRDTASKTGLSVRSA